MIREIETGRIKVKLQKDGKILFQVLSAWQWDVCPLANSGGQCVYFEQHDGGMISYLVELKGLEAEHPNFKNLPSEEHVRLFQSEVIKAVGAKPNATNNSAEVENGLL